MSEYITLPDGSQGEIIAVNGEIYAVAADTGEVMPVVRASGGDGLFFETGAGFVQVETLKDRFDWRGKKKANLTLADAYRAAGYPDYAERARGCSRVLEFLEMEDGRRDLHRAMLCKLRLCPICTARKAMKNALLLTRVLDQVEADHPGTRFLFLTLTVRNCPASGLSETIDLLMAAWSKLRRRRVFDRAVMGWFRALEITRNEKNPKSEFHPHFHAILAVSPDYFKKSSGLYIDQKTWGQMWRQSLKTDYTPHVSIEAAGTAKKGGKPRGPARKEAVEAAKYCVKSSDFLKQGISRAKAAHIVKAYTDALRGRRLTAFGGWMKDAAEKCKVDLEAEADLIHLDEDAVREDIADYVVRYGWTFGAGDYLLWSRETNPDKVMAMAAQDDID